MQHDDRVVHQCVPRGSAVLAAGLDRGWWPACGGECRCRLV